MSKIDEALKDGSAPILKIFDKIINGERIESLTVGNTTIDLPDFPNEADYLEIFDYVYSLVAPNSNLDWMFLLTGEENMDPVPLQDVVRSLRPVVESKFGFRIPRFAVDLILSKVGK